MVHLDWPGAAIYAHSGTGPIPWDGQTWLGAADYGAFNVPAEEVGAVTSDAILSVAVPDGELDAVMSADVLHRKGEVLGILTTERSGNVLIDEPFQLFSGTMRGLIEMVETTDNGLITVVRIYLGAGPCMRASATSVHSEEDQAAAFPGDTIGRLLINGPDRMKRVVW
ncbi:MAG: hypothetical protein ACWA5A_09250 [Marinibacterium sp.]